MSDTGTHIIQLTLPATTFYLNVLSACIGEMLKRARGLEEPGVTTYKIQRAINEACVNIINHAQRGQLEGRIEFTFTLDHRTNLFRAEIQDIGICFHPDDMSEPTAGELREDGHGPFLMRELMDDVTYSAEPGCNRWIMVKQLS